MKIGKYDNAVFEAFKYVEIKVRNIGNFSEMLDQTINKYRNRTVETKEVIEELIKLARIMNEAQEKD